MRSWFIRTWKIILFGVIVALISSLPYIYGYLSQKEGYVFLGRSVVNSADTYVYLSNIAEVKQGNIILSNLYTTESKTSFIIRPTYIFLGIIARLFNLTPLAVFHIGRIFFTIIFVIILNNLLKLIFADNFKKNFALVTVLFSSGLGVLMRSLLPQSIDLWVPESNTFFMLLESPHFIVSQILIILFIYYLIRYLQKSKYRYLLLSSFFSCVLILEHPFMAPFIYLIVPTAFYFIQNTQNIKKILAILIFYLLPSIPILIYVGFYLSIPAFKMMQQQNILPTPSLVNVISGYGLLMIFMFIGIYKSVWKNMTAKILFFWIIILFLLIYSPLSFQRRLLESIHIPISIFASTGILYIYSRISRKINKYAFFVILLLILSITNFNNVLTIVTSYAQNDQKNVYYLDIDEMTGIQWLGEKSSNKSTILASEYYSNIIPGITGRFVYQGHRIQTYQSKAKLELFNSFMEVDDDKFRRLFLKKFGINYIFFGKDDPYNIYRFSFENKQYLKKVWEKNGVNIFEVIV